ncbi:MAG: nucleotidyltransferase family protein [Actinomycetota bacterium]
MKEEYFFFAALSFFLESKMSVEDKENERRWLILRAKLHQSSIKAAFKLFRENGIEPILIKGWAAAVVYPEKYKRIYNDIDLCVAPGWYAKARVLVNSEEGKKLNIDLHAGLRHLDTVDWNDLFENSRIIMIDDIPVRVLRPEDHLRVLCVHWLTDGGAYKDKLLDFFYLIESNRLEFDWDRCLNLISNNRRNWILKTIGLTNKYYGLDISELPFADEMKNIPQWLVKTVESEWSTKINLKPMHTLLKNKKEFWIQLKKRIPPNAIQATIDMEGNFDDSTRMFYQIGSVLVRLKPSLKRFCSALKASVVKP